MFRNIGSYWILNGIQVLMFMVLTPYVVTGIGNQGYGIWQYVLAATGPLQLLVLGIPVATVRNVSSHLALGDHAGANRALGESLSLAILLGGLAMLVGLALYFFFPALSADWNLPIGRLEDAQRALLIVSLQLAIGFALRLPYAVFNAHQDFVVRNLIMGAGLLLRLGLTILLLSWRTQLDTLAMVQLLVVLAEFAIARAVSSRRHPSMRFLPVGLTRAGVTGILSFGTFALLLQMGTILAFRLDSVIIGHLREPEDIATYGFANKLFEPLYNLLMAIAMVVLPMASSLHAKGRHLEVRNAFLKWSKIASALVLMVGGYLLILGPAFLRWWLPANAYSDLSASLMQVLLLSLFLFLPVRAVALPILMGIGKPKRAAVGLLGMGIANLGLSLILVRPYGLLGVALGTTIPGILFSVWLGRNACSQLGLRFRDWTQYSFLRSSLAAVACCLLLLIAKSTVSIEGFWPLAVAGLAYMAVYGLLQVSYVFYRDRHLDLAGLLTGLLCTAKNPKRKTVSPGPGAESA